MKVALCTAEDMQCSYIFCNVLIDKTHLQELCESNFLNMKMVSMKKLKLVILLPTKPSRYANLHNQDWLSYDAKCYTGNLSKGFYGTNIIIYVYLHIDVYQHICLSITMPILLSTIKGNKYTIYFCSKSTFY